MLDFTTTQFLVADLGKNTKYGWFGDVFLSKTKFRRF